ncbi:MAG: copper resistance protein NlpE N-terminal domain-containing protein [Chitinophagaceae bacterium]|jgi:heat shock protein HslJ|nr:copper resistance protein NlpE N-terminal domain-containing protein [Chitinophagaceae bacterium]
MKRYPVLSISILVLSVFSFISCSPNKSSPEAVTQKDSGIVAKTLNINWGYYKSITPCADCEGIETVINLKKDNSFEEWSKYLGKKDTVFYRSGNIAIADNTTIQLIEGADTTLFHISTSAITMLDKTGDKVTGALADKYIFKQISSNGITNKYWVLKELNRQPVTAPNKSQAAYFILNEADTTVKGYGGCNILFGKYELNEAASRIRFLNTAATQRACIDAHYETDFFNVLNTADNYNLVGDTLFLNKARMAPLARFEAVYLQ